jgi:signal transduction histidine kinase
MASWPGSRLAEGKADHVFLSTYRVFALAVAIFQIFYIGQFQTFSLHNWILLGVVIAYTTYKVLHPFPWYRKSALTHHDFGFDLALAAALPLLTGGLYSPFLLYCLCPILTSGLFFRRKLTFFIITIPMASLIMSQLFLYATSPLAEFYPFELSLGLLIIFIVGSFLLAWLPYMMNINASQAIRSEAILSERRRLSREIHDGVAQSLGVVRWKTELLQQTIAEGKMLQALAQATEVKALVDTAQQEVREAIDELRVTQVGEQGLASTLARYATQFTQTYGIRCELHLTDGKVKLPLTAELELLRIAQEALSNVRRHSAANKVEVIFESEQDNIEMTIRDNGHGFDPRAKLQGYGVSVMEERARSLGGELSINTTLGHGTEVKVMLPVPNEQWLAMGDHIQAHPLPVKQERGGQR